MPTKITSQFSNMISIYARLLVLLVLSGCEQLSPERGSVSSTTPNKPPRHPFLADSHWPIVHGDTGSADFVDVSGPMDISRRLDEDEILWKKVGPANSWEINYSGLYPDGSRVIWAGCMDRIVKLDVQTLETIAELKLEGQGREYWTDEATEAFVQEADELRGQALYDHILGVFLPKLTAASCVYRFLDKNNDLYMLHTPIGEGPQFLKVFGDGEPGNARSDIVLKRQWEIPADLAPGSRGFGLNMTYDGWIIIVSYSGVVIAVNRDFTEYHHATLPRQADSNLDFFGAFMRNGFAIDDEGGIYVVTAEYMSRIQWTGKKLSLDPKDGAWTATYPIDPPEGDRPVGSGTTPTLMGWGKDNDRLVVIADGKMHRSSLVAYWRDKIPEDWQGIPGQPRRVAGLLPISFGNDDPEKPIRMEQSPTVDGYGIFASNFEVGEIPPQGSPAAYWLAQQYAVVNNPQLVPSGGLKAVWDPAQRVLKREWTTDVSCSTSVATGSRGSQQIYCFGIRDKEWTLEALDWQTGNSSFHYLIGSSHRYNIAGGIARVGAQGVIDCSCAGGMGIVRLKPKLDK